MRRFFLCVAVSLLGALLIGSLVQTKAFVTTPIGAQGQGGSGCAEATAFLARNSGENSVPFTTAICGMVADGVWTMWDALYVPGAALTTGNAILNLKSASFPLTLHGTPTFTANAGYTGVNGSSTVYADTGFNPATASTPNYVQDSATLVAWSLTNNKATASSANGMAIGAQNSVGTTSGLLQIWSTTDETFLDINLDTGGVNAVVDSFTTAQGSFIGTRTASNLIKFYYNGAPTALTVGSTAASTAVANFNMYALALDFNGTPCCGNGNQFAAFGIGSKVVDDAHGLAIYNRLCALLTATHGSC